MTRTNLQLAVVAWLPWFLCFVVLRRFGTWLPFVFVGVSLTFVGVGMNAVPPASWRPTLRNALIGVGGGLGMVLLTHFAFAELEARLPGVRPATQELLTLFNMVGLSPVARAVLIAVIASCEEFLFRGLLPFAVVNSASAFHAPSRRELVRLLTFTGLYALSTAPLRNPLLTVCALCCGSIWGMMRLLTGSLLVPLIAHVVWDLGVLVVWPITSRALS